MRITVWAMASSGGELFGFEGFTLDLTRGCLLGGAGEIELRPKSFELLRYLVENAGRLIPKDELVTAVWPNVIVSDDSLAQCVSELRRALGDPGRRIIKTVLRRGYLFAAPVSVQARHSPVGRPSTRGPNDRDLAPGSVPSGQVNDMPLTRRLTAILAADVAGYSRLMGVDEAGTHKRLKAHLRELVDPKIREHRGRIVKNTGDGFLAEFESVVDAVRCATEIQRGMVDREPELPAERQIRFRIGINLGDVIAEEDDIFGDGVNVAARLEALAEPGGICVSRMLRDQVRDRLDFAFEDMGERQVKNIVRPVRVYRVRDRVVPVQEPSRASPQPSALPDKPSVAVLPFTNMSSDPEQEFFADGIAEDIITALSRYPSLFVIARNSSFTYKGRAVDVKQVGRDLGVRYVLEGGLRKSGPRIRVTAQLVEAESGKHVWADRYDRDLADIFAVQDEISAAVTIAIAPAITAAEQQRAMRKPPASLDAWAAYQRASFAGGYMGLAAVVSNEADYKGGDLPPITPVALGNTPSGSASWSAERRQLTVMLCDLVGSTPLSSRLDPEDLSEVIAAYHRAVADVVTRLDGFISRYMGDGVLAYFGHPQAHEDDAERAVHAGLTCIDAVGRLDVKSVKLQARVGIATGLVVVGDLIGVGSPQEQSVVGESPNLASRLQALAEPDTVVIDAGTRRLIGDLFEYRDLGAVALKGFAEPTPVWQVLRPSGVESRFEALHGSRLSRLVGRDEEIDLLLRRWARVKAGDGQVVLISGEPGIGKSRIGAELVECLHTEPHVRARYFCSPYYQDSALYPFIHQLRRAAGFARDDPPAARLEKLEALLAQAEPPKEDVALLIDLLSLPGSEHHPLPNLVPQRKKDRTFEALIHQFEGVARRHPVVVVFEDAHWIDPTSRELLDLFVERVRSLPALLIVTFRPEFQPPWSGQPQVTMLALNRLDRRDRTALVEQIAGGKSLPAEIVDQIAERTDGVPLFIEELTRSVLESGLLREEADRYALYGALPPLAIPTTLHASLLARLDRLSSVRLVAQIGSAIGREFSYTLLRAVSRIPENELQAALVRLVASELVFQRGAPPDAVYSFKHALVQDAAHSSLLRNTRELLHSQIADALETHSPELMDTQPELFARHYAEAGRVEKSVTYWGKAGHRSAARSAMTEAAAQFQRGIDQLALLPNTLERQRQELEFYSVLGAVLAAAEGYAAPETGDAYDRARQLWEQLGRPSEFLHIPRGQSIYYAIRGQFDLALRMDEDLLRLSQQRNDVVGLVLGHLAFGRNLMFSGRFTSSRSHLEEALARYDPISHGSLGHQAGVHPHLNAQALLEIVFFCLGYPHQALAESKVAIAEARRLGHQPSLAVAVGFGARLLLLIGDNGGLSELAGQLVTISTEQSFIFWRALGTIYNGWIKVQNGDAAQGISLIRSGSTAHRATGAEAWVPFHLGLLGRACGHAGQIEEAATVFDEALQIAERTGERWFAAELNRHKGQLLLRQGHTEIAEALYCKALGIAQDQEAKLWELRAAVSLARLRRDQGRRTEACDLLAPVYGWFAEGFDTADLKEAKALLEELG